MNAAYERARQPAASRPPMALRGANAFAERSGQTSNTALPATEQDALSVDRPDSVAPVTPTPDRWADVDLAATIPTFLKACDAIQAALEILQQSLASASGPA